MIAPPPMLDVLISHDQLNFGLGQKVHHVFGAAVQLGMTTLTAKPLTSVTVRPVMPAFANPSRTSHRA